MLVCQFILLHITTVLMICEDTTEIKLILLDVYFAFRWQFGKSTYMLHFMNVFT